MYNHTKQNKGRGAWCVRGPPRGIVLDLADARNGPLSRESTCCLFVGKSAANSRFRRPPSLTTEKLHPVCDGVVDKATS